MPPCRITDHQTPTGLSRNRRLQFVQLVLKKWPTPERYLSPIFFSDEKSFPSDGLLAARITDFGVEKSLT